MEETSKRKRRLSVSLMLSAVVAAGLFLRLFFVFQLHYEDLHLGTGYTHDEYNYIHMIQHFFTHGIYSYFSGAPDALVTPGYPLFLGIVFFLFGIGEAGILAVKIIQAVLSTLSVVLVFFITLQLTEKKRGALIAAALLAISPAAALYSRFILTETLYLFLLLLYVSLQLLALKKEKKRFHLLAGLFFGLAVLVRPMVIILGPVPYVWKMIQTRTIQNWGKGLLVFFLPTFLLLLPWTLRNWIVLGKWIPLASQTNPFYAGLAEDPSTLPVPDGGFSANLKLLFSLLVQQPITMLKWFFYKKVNILFAWSAYWLPEGVVYFIPLDNMTNIFIKGAGALGLCYALIQKPFQLFAVWVALYMSLALLFVPNSRFGLQYLPFFCIFAGMAVQGLFRRREP